MIGLPSYLIHSSSLAETIKGVIEKDKEEEEVGKNREKVKKGKKKKENVMEMDG